MTGVEIFLIFIGIIAIVGSFIFASQFDKSENPVQNSDQYTKEILEKKVNEAVDQLMDQKIEKTEVQLEKLSTEKIMAVGNYSDNVLADINKNHDEVMFLYGMLNDKEKDVKNTIIDIENVKKSVKQINKEINSEINDKAGLAENDQPKGPVSESEYDSGKNKDKVKSKEIADDEKKSLDNEPTQFKVVIKDPNKKNKETIKKTGASRNKTNNNQKILDLYKKGKSSIEIAKELHLGIGEVRLVIDLFKNRQ